MSFGSQRGFAYTDDDGSVWSKRADESNIEMIHTAPTAAVAGSAGVPKDIHIRRVRLIAPNGSTKTIPVLTTAVYNAISVGDTYAAPSVGEENTAASGFVVQQKIPERILRRVTSVDTGKNDGDNP